MALISKVHYPQKEKVKVEIRHDVLTKIQEYCQWSQIEDLGFFIEEAACFIFSKDKDWKSHQRNIKKVRKAREKLKES